MTNPIEPTPTPSYGAPARPRSTFRLLVVLILLVLLAGAGVSGWMLWKQRSEAEATLEGQQTLLVRLSRQVGDTQAELEAVRNRQNDLVESQRRAVETLAQMQERADETSQTLGRLDAAVQGGRSRAQLIAVEQLLLIASDRAQLAHDPRGAAAALDLAQNRLGTLADPKLIEVRKAVSEERAALLALPQADTEGAAVALNTLIARAADLPQRSRAPHHLASTGDDGFGDGFGDAAAASDGAWSRAGASLRAMLKSVFVIRRTDKPVDKLLPAEQETLVGQLLLLKLETARTALLRDDAGSFKTAIDEARRFLADYYRAEDPSVLSARAELDRLGHLELTPAVPELGRSLALLRASLDAAR